MHRDGTRELLDAALEYAQLGWRVLPLHTAKPECSCGARLSCRSAGKHPTTRHGVLDATTDASQIRAWWAQSPNANVGIATGPGSGPLVIDIDPRHDGTMTMQALERELGGLPPTITTATGGGGLHFFFRAPKESKVRGTLGCGVDVKYTGGFVVAPPSLHASGRRYSWRGESPLRAEQLAILPAGWLDRLRPKSFARPSIPFDTRRLTEGDRALCARRYARALPPAISGAGGHRTTFLAAAKIAVGFALDAETAFEILWTEWNGRCEPPWSERELRRKVGEALKARCFPLGFVLDRRGGVR